MLYGAVIFLSCLQANATGDWPGFRGPGGMGVSEAKGLPVS